MKNKYDKEFDKWWFDKGSTPPKNIKKMETEEVVYLIARKAWRAAKENTAYYKYKEDLQWE